jgi:hypothetical protein
MTLYWRDRCHVDAGSGVEALSRRTRPQILSYYSHPPSKTMNGHSLQVLSGNGNGDASTVTEVTTETKEQVSKEAAAAAVTPEHERGWKWIREPLQVQMVGLLHAVPYLKVPVIACNATTIIFRNILRGMKPD